MAFRAFATAGDGETTNPSSLTITIPATAQIGDVAVLNCATTNTTQTLTTPTGWTLQDNSVIGSGSAWLFTKTLVSGDPGASVALTWTGTSRPTAAMRVYSGVTMTGSSLVSTNVGTAATSLTVPTMTGVPAGANIDIAVSARAAVASGFTATFPSPYTAEGSAGSALTTSPNDLSTGAYNVAGAGGTYGGETITVSSSATAMVYALVLPNVVVPAAASLVDDFTTKDTTKWTWGAGASATGGQVVFTADAAYDGDVWSGVPYNLTGSASLVQLVQAPTDVIGGGTGAAETYFHFYDGGVNDPNKNTLSWHVNGPTLEAFWKNASGTPTSLYTATYSATTHAWLRIREAAGTVYFETSADGTIWTSRATLASSSVPITSMYQQIGNGVYGGATASKTSIFDNYNNPPTNRITKIATVQTANAGNADASIVVPAGVTPNHFGLIAFANSNGGGPAFPVPPPAPMGWTTRINPGTGSTGTMYLWTRLGGHSAGDTITITQPSNQGGTTTAIWYDTGGRDIQYASAEWDTAAADLTTMTFQAPGQTSAADVLLAMPTRTSAANTLPAPTGVTSDFYGVDSSWIAGAFFGHALGVTSRSYTSTWTPSGGTSHNSATMQFALASSATVFQRAIATAGDGATSNVNMLNITVPATVQLGDVAVLTVEAVNNSATLTVPSGWTQVDYTALGGSIAAGWLLTKTITAGDAGSSITLDFGGVTCHPTAQMRVYANATLTGAVFGKNTYTTAGTSYTIPTLTGVTAGSIVDVAVCARTTGNATNVPAPTVTGNYALAGQTSTAIASSVAGWQTTLRESAALGGSYGGETVTTTQSSTAVVYAYALPTNAPSSQSYTAAPVDNVGLTDSVTVVRTVVKSVADSVGITDSVPSALLETLVPAGPDSVGITDAKTVVQGLARAPVDNVGLTDSVTIVRQVFQTKTDSVGVTDAASKAAGVTRTASDSIGLTDAASVHQDIQRTATDSVGITDAPVYGGTFSQPVVVTGSPDIERQTAELEEVGRLTGTAGLRVNMAARDLRVGPQRAQTSIGMTGDLTHVTGLHGTAAPELDTSLTRLNVVHAMTDIVVRQEVEIAPPMTLGNGPIYSTGGQQSATGGVEVGVLGPTKQPVWRLDRNEACPVGWGAYVAADIVNNVPVGTTVTLSVWWRANGGFVNFTVVANNGQDSPAPTGWQFTGNGQWQQFVETFTLTADWTAGYQRFRAALPELGSGDYIEWSDPTIQLTPNSDTGVPADPAYVGTATVGTSTTAPANMQVRLRPMEMAKETVKKVSRIFRTLR